ncbi:PTS sugar transporter subunit IIA [Heyndrickxia acidiproducens]|uniref:PTS sugar transporter subunit IIA n=1 Tax=Heyndrickxia acidiproducens TaxID=1121084 RepID=UPI00037DAFFD|nr:fructose PTS transporter subunit IIA [Heyndrickxia acidiproducens]
MPELFTINNIKLNTEASTKEEVFQSIARAAVENGYASNENEIVKGLLKREEESTTGFLDGFAIPHTKNAAVQAPGIMVQTFVSGVEWQSLDGEPVKFVIALLIPDNEAGTTHLGLLSKLAKMLMHQDVRDKLAGTENKEEVLKILTKYLV